jgi:hypothetical protein
MQRVCQISLEEGFHCYDEMFMWAHDLIARTPECAAFIRDRFPVLFLDEAQDNSEDQSALLALVFRVGGTATLRQRFGDSNQAIFDSIAGSGAVTDKFPESSVKRDLPDSHRFGQRIADLAAPLGLDPQQLKGKGPATSLVSESAEEQHTLFLFGNGAEHKVLSAYAEVLLATFSNEGLAAGSFIAVGQVHRPPVSEDPAKTPQHIGQYWPEYSHELTGQDPKPATLRDYILLGIAKTLAMGETRFGVEAITSGIMRLVSMTEGKTDLSRGRLAHQQIVRALSEHATIRRRYEYLICRFILKGLAPSKPLWEKVWTSLIKEVVETVAGAEVKSVEALQFLAWSDATPQGAPGKKKATAKYNVFKYPPDDHKVSIRVGSIHSVKGETCTAALILETFWYTHNLTSLRPWLDGSRFGAKEAGERDKARLKLHYVGFSRPTHLLCVAMKESSFWNDKGELDQSLIARMEARGWRVKLL